MEALLRSRIQFLPGVRFVFAGSRKHMMEEMFASPRRPFYQSTQMLSLREIPCDLYAAFAKRFFDDAGLPFDAALFADVYHRFDGVTWYVQAVMNRIWAIAREGVVPQPLAGRFISSYNLRATSSAAFSLNDLRNRDLIYETDSGWIVYDRLFGLWLKSNS